MSEVDRQHLDGEALVALLNGALPPEEEGRWREHLLAGCDDCLAALDEDEAHALFAFVDRVHGRAPSPESRAAAREAFLSRVPQARSAPAWRLWGGLGFGASLAAAALLLVFQLSDRDSAREPDYVKGDGSPNARAVPLRLDYLVGPLGAAVDALRPSRGDRSIRADQQVLWRLSFEAAVKQAVLLRVAAADSEAIEVLKREPAVEAGVHLLQRDGQVLTYGFEGMRGAHHFLLLGSAKALPETPSALRAITRTLHQGAPCGWLPAGEVAYCRVTLRLVEGRAPPEPPR